MAARDQVIFRLYFEHRDPETEPPFIGTDEAKYRFWVRHFGGINGPESAVVAKGEQNILNGSFAAWLAEKISLGAGTRSGDDGKSPPDLRPDKPRRLPRSDFSVSVLGPIRYGSAELTIVLEGVRRVVEAFDHDFELFRSVIETYAPEAWQAAVGGGAWPALTCSLRHDEGLRAAFEAGAPAPAPAPAPGQENERARRLRWLWIASNTSLILPCLLALVVLYLAGRHVSQLESELANRAQRLEDHEAAFVKAHQARERELHLALVEVVKVAGAPAPTPACCCPPAAPPPAPARPPAKVASCPNPASPGTPAPRP